MSSRDQERQPPDIAAPACFTPDFRLLFDASPTPLLVVAPPDWTIVAANDARLRVTRTTREEQIGRRLFDVFPEDPEDPDADGVRNLNASLERVVATRMTDTMPVQRYSLREADGRFTERWWAPVNRPVLGENGEVALIVHHVEDVTEVIRLRGDADGHDELARTQQVVIDRLRASEAALRDAEERYLALFTAIDQGFCTVQVAFDEDGKPVDYRFLEISPSFERQTGIANGAGRWMREIAPDQDQVWFDTYGRVAITGNPERFENYSTPLGRWFDVYAFRISGEHRVAILFRDITDQKRAEAALRDSEARLAFLDRLGAETAPLGDAEAVLAATTRLLGEHLSLSVCAYADMDEDQDGFTIRGDWAAPGANSIVGHYRLADFGKLAVENLSAGLPLVINDNLRELPPEEAATFHGIGIAATICMPLVKHGRLTALMAIHDRLPRAWTEAELNLLREVTDRSWAHVERVGAAADLRRSEERNRRMVEGVQDHAIFTTDGEGRIVDWTPGAEAVFGWPAAEIQGQSSDLLFVPEDRAAGVPARELAVARGEGCANDERWHIRRDGSRFFANGSVRPLHDADGQIAGFIKIARDETPRRSVDAALRLSEERYRTLFEAIDAGFCIVELKFDAQGSAVDHFIVEVNPAFERHTGIADAGGRWASEVAPGLEQHWHDTYARVASTGEAVRFEQEVGPFGRWYDVHAFRVGEPGQNRVAVLFNDISERRRADLELRALNADLERKVTERALSRGRTWQLSPEIMGVLNADGYFEQSNPAWASVLGWSVEEIARTIFFDFIHPDDLARTRAVWDAAIERGEPALRFENRYRTKDGSWRWLSWVAVPDDGKIYCTARDVTAEKEQEAALAERTAERDRMWRLSTDLMLVAGFDGTITSVNPAWKTMLGWNDGDLIGNNFLTFVHPDDQQPTIAEMGKLDQGITTFRFENRYRASDGEHRWISWTAVPDAGFIHAVGRDITAEKEAAADLEAAQEALRQSQKMEAMGQLTGGVAHDFNNLLTPIVGSLDMLQRKGVGNEREQRLIAGAMQSADRAKTLVQRLLAFARRQPLQASAVDIGGLVTGMADLVASTSGPQIKVVVDAAQDLPPAKADPNQLEMALLNLGVNARDAMPDGGTLRITADHQPLGPGHRSNLKPGDYIRLSVADTGIGMDEATMKRAVEPFFSTKGVGKGTGLGLSMAHGLASQLGGALTIQSRPGVGTNVELWLPLSAELAPLAKAPAIPLPIQAGRGTALLVDDEELVRMSTADMLADMGFAVVEAGSAEEALRLLDGGLSADLLVTDHLMPGMNGTDLARAIRSTQPDLQVLIVSGYAETEGVDPDLPRLTKPFRNADLAAKLSELAGD